MFKEKKIKYREIYREGDFWRGMGDGTGAALYDDFRCSDMKAAEFIRFIDYNMH